MLMISFHTLIHLCAVRFWKRAGYVPLYIRQTTGELTGEHACVMVRGLSSSVESELEWLGEFAQGLLLQPCLVQ
jgi:tRNA(Met) C34 N-acetyltransferase TmcA